MCLIRDQGPTRSGTMSITQTWFGESSETRYTIALEFSESEYWSNAFEGVHDDSEPAWRQLELPQFEGMFFCRILAEKTRSVSRVAECTDLFRT